MTQQQAHDGRVLTVVGRGEASYSHRWEIGDALVVADRGMLHTMSCSAEGELLHETDARLRWGHAEGSAARL